MRCALISVLLIAAACSRQSDTEQAATSARSWRATVDLVASGMHAQKVSPRYAKQVAERAKEELTKNKTAVRETKEALDAARRLHDECERR